MSSDVQKREECNCTKDDKEWQNAYKPEMWHFGMVISVVSTVANKPNPQPNCDCCRGKNTEESNRF
jgi:hypothetical protein